MEGLGKNKTDLSYSEIQERIVQKNKKLDPKIKNELDQFEIEYQEMMKTKKEDSLFVKKIWKETAQQVELGISPLQIQQQLKLEKKLEHQENLQIKEGLKKKKI